MTNNRPDYINTITQIGLKRRFKDDVYFFLMQSSWPRLLFIGLLIFFIFNLFFAFVYYFCGGINGVDSLSFAKSFFFSVQTMSTIGYGALYPESNLANIVASIEAALGLVFVSLMTGVVFSKLSSPNAKIMFSKNILNTSFEGNKVLSARIGNLRGNDIVGATLSMSALFQTTTKEGKSFRKVVDLKLTRSVTPFFRLSWILMHEIDDNSPLIKSPGKLLAITVAIKGHDTIYGNTVYARHVYLPKDIVKDQQFADIISSDPNDGNTIIDYSKFDDLVKDYTHPS